MTQEKGGAVYAARGVPDTNADGLFGRCQDKTDDFTRIEEGEAVHIAGHIGVYVGGGLVVECTPNWENGVQITALGNLQNEFARGLYRVRSWDKHGKLPWIDYGDPEETENGETEGAAEEDLWADDDGDYTEAEKKTAPAGEGGEAAEEKRILEQMVQE